jgi:hypothetical protein
VAGEAGSDLRSWSRGQPLRGRAVGEYRKLAGKRLITRTVIQDNLPRKRKKNKNEPSASMKEYTSDASARSRLRPGSS